MTGSAFPMHIGRGTLCIGWLRRITYFSTELREGQGGGAAHRSRGWRMTGSAFPMHIGRGTLWLRVAPQDNLLQY